MGKKSHENPDEMEHFDSDGRKARKASPIGRAIVAVVIVLVLGVLLFNSAYQIKEQEQAVLVTLGRASAVTDPGLHFKVPFIQTVRKVNTTIQGFTIGYDPEGITSRDNESTMITHDYNFVDIDFYVEYRFSEPVKAVFASSDPVAILKSVCMNCIRTVVSSYGVDDVLTTGKNEIQAAIKESIIRRLEAQDIGVQLVNITIQDAEPPTDEVMEAFKAVETAKQGKETAINTAKKYQSEQIPAAEARADSITKSAEAAKTARINEATAQVARFNAMYEEYVKNPGVTRQRMFYEAMEDILPGLKVVITDGGSEMQTIYPLESFTGTDAETTGGTADAASGGGTGTQPATPDTAGGDSQ